jgi:arylsulfatase A-like enzyme
MTGSHPNQHGIVSNYWPNRETGSLQYCVQDNNGNFTPENLVRPTLGDLLKDHDHQSKVYSISAKDRAAIIMAGKKGDAAYWYDKENGTFQSSDYYDNSAPQWLKEFNSLKLLDSFFSQSWTPLPVDSNSLRLAKIRTLDQGVFKKQLPLPVGGITLKPDSVFYTDIMNTPFIDEYTGLMAEEVLKKEQLGLDDHTDILAVSFSATDLIGHEYGPNSVEILDNILRLDATIEHLLSNVEKLVGLEKVLVVFSSDHGVQAMPELKGDSDKHHRRISTSNIQCIQGALNNEPDIKNMVTSYFTVTDLKALPVIKSAIKKCPYIDNVWTVLDINTPSKNPYQQLYANSYFKGRSPDLFIQWRENFLPMFHKETNHGTPYPYDAHVPVIFYGANIEPKKIDQPFDTTMIVQHTINHLK